MLLDIFVVLSAAHLLSLRLFADLLASLHSVLGLKLN